MKQVRANVKQDTKPSNNLPKVAVINPQKY